MVHFGCYGISPNYVGVVAVGDGNVIDLGMGGAVSKSGLELLMTALGAPLAGDEDVARVTLAKLSRPPEPQTSRRGIPVRTQAIVFERNH